jgi:hypothetical protein
MYLSLIDIPDRTHVKVIDEDADASLKGQVFFFDHSDGVYSFCIDKTGGIVNLALDIEVLPVKGFE